MNTKNSNHLRLIAPLIAAMISGCASSPVATFPPFVPEDLNPKIQSGAYKQKADTFLVIMDASSSMETAYRGTGFEDANEPSKFAVEREFLNRMNQTIPNLPLTFGLRTFGFGSCNDWEFTRLNASLAPYSRPAFQNAVDSVECVSGGSPIGKALVAASSDLQSVAGRAAVIVVSDGKQASGEPRKAVENLRTQFGDRLCVHTVWVGNPDERGRALMSSLPTVADCGTSVDVADVASSAGMARFVETVFLEGGGAVGPLDSDGDGVLDPDDQCPGTPKGAKVNAVGCWVLANVLFDTDRSTLQPISSVELDEVIRVFENNPGLRVEVDGHTDSQGSDAHNLDLSQRRAEAVREYLVRGGIASDRLTAKGFGESMPVASNDTSEGRALNRRVELQVLR